MANGATRETWSPISSKNQIKRDQLYIVGIPCEGMIDHRAVARVVKQKKFWILCRTAPQFVVKERILRRLLKRQSFCKEQLRGLQTSQSVIHDEMLGDPVEEQTDVNPIRTWRKSKPWIPKRNRGFSRGSSAAASDATPAGTAAPCVTVPPVSWTNPRPSGWEKASIHGYHDLSFPEGLSLWRDDAPIAVL